ncbi:uncharacterized protein B0I36DRAFT_363439 [Microdochium trichocladiopsis]|uniref:Uncharacterized protein n=1 Tax=Microdochium trichocladiopsis TaxID=1682393 RepID=A0A9P8Y339_9PEZI|nr:uncharacterized protein B0I36DRAFT_363439 [Microdochium trichocladiopsis]KAH7028816.1 hypothetical protein B0I36DRAFT_363439 [Microdochium trichocladiopsis]
MLLHRRISIRNKSGTPHAYYLVPADPSPKTSTNGLTSTTCVFQASLKVASPNGSAVFSVPRNVLAVCGTARTDMKPGAQLFASDWAVPKLATPRDKGSNLAVALASGEEPSFKPESEETTVDGDGLWATEIMTGGTGGNPGTPFVGYGFPNPHNANEVLPAAVWQARPGAAYTFHCEQKWHVVSGVAEAHDVAFGEEVGKGHLVTFEDTQASEAEVIHDTQNGFTVRYL